MAIDFSALVLAPCMDTFARTFLVRPVVSQPGASAFEARGIYTEQPVDLQLEDGRVLSSTTKTLGIRLSEFQSAPMQGDLILFEGATFLVDDLDDDGQGGSKITLKEIRS